MFWILALTVRALCVPDVPSGEITNQLHRLLSVTAFLLKLALSMAKSSRLVKFLLCYAHLPLEETVKARTQLKTPSSLFILPQTRRAGRALRIPFLEQRKQTKLLPASQILLKIICQLHLYCYPVKRIWRNKRNETNSCAHTGAILFTSMYVGKSLRGYFKPKVYFKGGSQLKRPGKSPGCAESEGNPMNQPHDKDLRPFFILHMN